MPYIKQDDRDKIYEFGQIRHYNVNTAGELQYAIAVMIQDYLERKGLNYQHCNDIMGALAGAQMEFYRRTVAPYEDQKIKENGDV
jgi:hypothetical protein